MPNKDGTGNALDGIKNIGIAILCFAPMVIAGIYEASTFVMGAAGAVGGAALGYFAAKSIKAMAAWAAIGAIAGVLFSFAI